MNTTGEELVKHWDWAAEKGLMNRNSASALRAACSQVLSVQENWESLDMTSIDVDEFIRRFENLRGKEFTPRSLETYAQRFRKAVGSFLRYAKEPSSWKPASRTRKRSVESPEQKGKRADSDGSAVEGGLSSASTSANASSKGLIDYPFPLRDNLVARLMLPRDVTAAEVKRLSGFMNALVVDDET